MSKSEEQAEYGKLLRFYSFAGSHWRMIIAAFLAMTLFNLVNGSLVLLFQPMIDAIAARQHAEASADQPPNADGSEAAASTEGGSPDDPAAAGTAVQQHADAGAAQPPDAGGAETIATEEEAMPDEPLEATKKRITGWLKALPPVRGAMDLLSPEGDPKKIALLIAFLIGPLLVISGFLQEYAHRRVVWSIMADIRVAIFEKISRLSLNFFARHRSGELVSRLTNDVNSTQVAVKILFGTILLEPMRLFILLGVAIYMSWELTLLAHVTFPPLIFVMGRYGSRIRRYGHRNLQRLADITDSITQMLSGIRVVKAFNMEDAECQAFRERNRDQLRQAFRLVRNRALAQNLPEYLYLLPVSLIVLLADRLISTGQLTVGEMLACMLSLGIMVGSVRRTVRAYADLQSSTPGVVRIFELLDTTADIVDSPDAVEIDGVREGIRYNNVWFGYDDEPVLRDIDLCVEAGSMYAIVGETGAGKSTLLDLIPRFYDVDRGSVEIDGHDVRNITRDSLMGQIGIVGQHPFLFNRSISENIRYGRPAATEEEVIEAARAANIHEFIDSLPDGYDTLVGESGGRLSGGQRQCVTIARALLKNAPILILDEATSSLDAQSEVLVQRGLNNLMAGRTTLVIAHRLSTVRHADKIIVLRGGRIVEQGSHDELLELGGEYMRLCKLQFMGQQDQPQIGGNAE